MLPIIMHFKIRQAGGRGFGLYFPVILVWILASAVLIALLPFLLLAALLTCYRGPGFALLVVYPLFFSTLSNLGGLRIDVKSAQNELLIDFP